jgi:hypothetical protein
LTDQAGKDAVLLPSVPAAARLMCPAGRGVELRSTEAGLELVVPAALGTAVLEWIDP